ncbi:MAG: hypothetical protein ACRCX2_12365 [Paraclostridium sp.]
MANKTYSNENTVSLWANTSQGGKDYLKGKVYVGNVAYDIILFPNDATSESQPVYRGKIELPKAK